MSEEGPPLERLQSSIGYRFKDPELLRKATTHGSFSSRGRGSYERLEFLGDAVLGLVIAQSLFDLAACHSKGRMTIIRSETVSRRSAGQAGLRLELDRDLRVGGGLALEEQYPISLIAEAYEALIGAVFLDGGFDRAAEVVLRTLGPELKAAKQSQNPPNYKAVLQELVQSEGQPAPTYRTIKQVGPDHERRFLVAACVSEVERGEGWGKTKKEAEQKAAESALEKLYQGGDSRPPEPEN